MKKLIQKRYELLLIDEYNTSKKCCNCYKELKKEKDKFRLLYCEGCEGREEYSEQLSNIGSLENLKKPILDDQEKNINKRYINRDLNACINMMKIVRHMIKNKGERKKEFRRGK